MRLLHVSEVDAGGVLSLIRDYTAEQTCRGHDVHLLARSHMDATVGAFHAWDVDRRAPHRLPLAVRQFQRVVRETRPEVVHLHSFFAGLLGRIVSRAGKDGPAVVYQPHSWSFDAVDRRLVRAGLVQWERQAARRTDFLIGNCVEEIDEGRDVGVTVPARPIGLPIDTDVFSPCSPHERAELRARRGLGDDKRIFLCVGRLSRQKAQDRLVAGWELEPVPGGMLVLIGSGDDRDLRRLAPREWGRSIRAVGHQDDVRDWLRCGDVLVQSSRYEGQSVAVAEALACGLPVVMMDVNGAAAAVTDGPPPAAGQVVDQDDVAALMAAMRARTDTSLLAREATAARQRATTLFASHAVVDGLDEAYRQAVGNRRARRSTR